MYHKRMMAAVSGGMFSFMAFFAGVGAPAQASEAAEVCTSNGRIVLAEVRGDVLVSTQGGTRRGKERMRLHAGDQIMVGAKGEAVVWMGGKEFYIGGNSSYRVTWNDGEICLAELQGRNSLTPFVIGGLGVAAIAGVGVAIADDDSSASR